MYIYAYINMYICIYRYTYVYMCVCMCICIYGHTYVDIYIYTRICIQRHTYTNMYMYVYMCISVRVYIYIYTWSAGFEAVRVEYSSGTISSCFCSLSKLRRFPFIRRFKLWAPCLGPYLFLPCFGWSYVRALIPRWQIMCLIRTLDYGTKLRAHASGSWIHGWATKLPNQFGETFRSFTRVTIRRPTWY